MNQEQASTLISALKERHEIVSPRYAELMSKFGSLALSGVALENLRQNTEREEANQHLVNSFIENLIPLSPDSRYYPADNTFEAQTVQEAKLIQSFVIWGEQQGNWRQRQSVPYIIIGHKTIVPKKTGGPDISLLLARTFNNDRHPTYHSVEVFDTFSIEYGAIKDNINRTLNTPYSDDQIKQMFDKDKKRLMVHQLTPGSVLFSLDLNYLPDRLPKKRKQLSSSEIISVKRRDSWHKFTDGLIMKSRGTLEALSDETLLDYDVYDHLGELATAFGKTDMLKNLITESVINHQDPLNRLIEETKS